MIILIDSLQVIQMTIILQYYSVSNSVSTFSTPVVYLVLKSPAWLIQRTD